jgi:hypothetical protein
VVLIFSSSLLSFFYLSSFSVSLSLSLFLFLFILGSVGVSVESGRAGEASTHRVSKYVVLWAGQKKSEVRGQRSEVRPEGTDGAGLHG